MDRKNGPRIVITQPIDTDGDGNADYYISHRVTPLTPDEQAWVILALLVIALVGGVLFVLWWLFIETAIGWWLLLFGLVAAVVFSGIHWLQTRRRLAEEQRLRARYGQYIPGPDIIAQDLLDEQERLAEAGRAVAEQDRRTQDWYAGFVEEQANGSKPQPQNDSPSEGVEVNRSTAPPTRPKRDLSKYIKFSCTDCHTSYMALRKPREREVVCRKCGLILILPAQTA